MYGTGLPPLLYSMRATEKESLGWHRVGTEISYCRNVYHYLKGGNKKMLTLFRFSSSFNTKKIAVTSHTASRTRTQTCSSSSHASSPTAGSARSSAGSFSATRLQAIAVMSSPSPTRRRARPSASGKPRHRTWRRRRSAWSSRRGCTPARPTRRR